MSRTAKSTLALADWNTLNGHFERAIEMSLPDREKFILELKSDSPDLAAELLSLLEAHDSAQQFLEQPVLTLNTNKAPASGTSYPGFTIKRPLGEGAFGVVYLAHQLSLDREVALKVTRNMGQEGKTMALFSHPNIVQVYSEEIDTEREQRLICMQYISGPSLAKLMDRAKKFDNLDGKNYLKLVDELRGGEISFDPTASAIRANITTLDSHELVCWLAQQLLQALAYAHSKSIIHLDVKPANILITPYGVPMLTDFNTSMSQASVKEGETSGFGGTFDYMAPEQNAVFWSSSPSDSIRGLDARVDIYSLGVLLKELYALSYRSGTANREVHFNALIKKSTEKNPSGRFSSTEAMLDAFNGALELSEVERSLPRLEKWLGFATTHPMVGILVCSLVPQLMGSVVNILYNLSQIVSSFNEAQQRSFEQLTLYYNAIVYVPGICLWIWQLHRIKKALNYANGDFVDNRLMGVLRGHTRQLPFWMAVICTIGWLPGAVFFPAMIQLQTGVLPVSIYAHFAISFLLSWLVSMSYSFLYLEYLSLRVIYPRLWIGSSDIRLRSRKELGYFSGAIRYFHFLIGFLPLAGACLMLYFCEPQATAEQLKAFHHLSIFLIILGMGGMVFGFRSIHQLSTTLYAFMGTEKK